MVAGCQTVASVSDSEMPTAIENLLAKNKSFHSVWWSEPLGPRLFMGPGSREEQMGRTVIGYRGWKNGEEWVFNFARSRMSGDRGIMASHNLGSPQDCPKSERAASASAEDRSVPTWEEGRAPVSGWRGSSAGSLIRQESGACCEDRGLTATISWPSEN